VLGLAQHVLGQHDAGSANVRAPASNSSGARHRGLETEGARGLTGRNKREVGGGGDAQSKECAGAGDAGGADGDAGRGSERSLGAEAEPAGSRCPGEAELRQSSS
jgi:hypothetical protein